MTAVLRFLFVIPIGFTAACFAAAIALLWPFVDLPEGVFRDPLLAVQLSVGFFAQSAQVGATALVPWAVFMVIAELFRLDGILLHAALGLAGGIVAAIKLDGGIASTSLTLAFAVAGLSFALFYWIVAGRGAGHWRARRSDPQENSE